MAKKNQSVGTNEPHIDASYIPADEVSIVELIRDIGRQWKVVVGVTLLCLLLVFSYTYFRTPQYRYTLDIEIGQAPREDLSKDANFIMLPPVHLAPPAFESLSAVRSQMGHKWIPNAVEDVKQDQKLGDQDSWEPEFDISIPEGSSREVSLIIRAMADAPKARENITKAMLRRVGVNASTQHASYLEQHKERLQRRVNELKTEKGKVERRQSGYDGRIRKLRDDVDDSRTKALAAAVELHALMPERLEFSRRMTEIDRAIAELEEKIKVLTSATQAFEIPRLDPEVLTQQQGAAAALASSLSMRPTRVLNLPTRSSKPLGEDSRILLTLALVLGLGAGVVLAIIVQAVARERNQGNEYAVR